MQFVRAIIVVHNAADAYCVNPRASASLPFDTVQKQLRGGVFSGNRPVFVAFLGNVRVVARRALNKSLQVVHGLGVHSKGHPNRGSVVL
jgi:hypothetical protein